MSWIQKLYETYNTCADAPQFDKKPWPVAHAEQQAHVEIVLDADGKFQRAALLDKEATLIPATEESAGRSGTRPPPHPLCDKIQYCAADYEAFGGTKPPFFNQYVDQLRQWQHGDANAKVGAVLKYVEKGNVVADLVGAGLLHCSPDRKLLTEWTSESTAPNIFKMLTAKEKKRDQGDAFVRWRVQLPGDPASALWEDSEVHNSWVRFAASREAEVGLCMVTGETTALAINHPRRIRHAADGAKLISSNDKTGYTFRGRVDLAGQTCGGGYEVTQKAHSALRWLIERQGYKNKDQVFIAWAVNGKKIPDPLANTSEIFGATTPDEPKNEERRYEGDVGQLFALRLKKAISGYRAELRDTDDVVVLGLDSATPGRIAITYYRELTGSEFLDRVNAWHSRYSWFQNFSKDNTFIGAPAPIEIAEAAHSERLGDSGRRVDANLSKATVERLLPCIVDGGPVPREIVAACVRRVCNRTGMKTWEWEKCLGIACALFKGSQWKENYQMSLEETRTSRDYLFGRLLAIAENIEQRALHLANEGRDTNAAKLMQRFGDRPCSTWRNIEAALTPYKTRLRAKRPSVLLERDKLLDTVMGMFKREDFISDSKLSGEFLLGYHCQRAALWPAGKSGEGPTDEIGRSSEKENL